MPLSVAQKMLATAVGFGTIATFIQTQVVYYVDDGFVGLLYNKNTDRIANYVMHPGSHIRFSWAESPVFLKINDVYHGRVEDVATADKKGKKSVPVDVQLKVCYKINFKDAPALYTGFGDQRRYPKEVFGDVTKDCVNSVLQGIKYADLAKGLESDEKFLRADLTKCIQKEATKYVTIDWAQIMSASKRQA